MKYSFLMLLFCCLLIVFSPAKADYWGDYEYITKDDGCIILSYVGNESEVSIPLSFGYYNVVEIGESAF